MKLTIARARGSAAAARMRALVAASARRSPDRCPRGTRVVEVNWIGERTMARLNRVYKRRTGAAEILTFPCGGASRSGGGELPSARSISAGRASCAGRGAAACRRARTRRGSSCTGSSTSAGYRHDDVAGATARMEAAEARFLRGSLSEREVKRLFA